jgi:hypothetical protein
MLAARDEWADCDDARVAVGGPALDVANFIGQAEVPALYDTPTRSSWDGFTLHASPR